MTAPGDVPPDVLAYAAALASMLDQAYTGPAAVYLHGSAVLGGFRPVASDVDVLAVIARPMPRPAQRELGERLAAVPGCPGTGLEMSVITVPTRAAWRDGRFEVHVNTAGKQPTVTPGGRHGRDPDLVLHCAVCREHGVAVLGPPATEVFDPIPRDVVLAAIVDELDWAGRRASTGYAVLNACRAKRFAVDGRLVSKVDGGEWYLARYGPDRVVSAALAFQRYGQPPPDKAAARRLLTRVTDQLRRS